MKYVGLVLLGILLIIILLLLIAIVRTLLMPKKTSDYKPDAEEKEALRLAEKLSKMVQCDTTSHAGETEVEKYLGFHKVLEELFPLVHKELQKTEIDGNLLYYWKGKSSEKPILLMSHQDVVPAEGEWIHAPFSGDIADGKVWGRGTADTKCTVMAFLEAVEELLAEGFVPPTDVYLASSCTEEWAGDGAPKLVKELQRRGIRLFLLCDEGGAIITEPVGGIHGNFAMVGVFEKGKADVKFTAKSIVDEAKVKGRAALYRVSEFLGIKNKLLNIRENVRGAIRTTDKDIAKTALLGKGLREAGQTAANAFRTFADKPEVDYSQKEQKHPITKAVLAPMKAVKKMLVSMELHLDASIDKLDNLAMNVQIDKEKHTENEKKQEQTEPEMAEAKRVEAEIVYSPMVAEPQEYQYNADAFEARGVDDVKQEAAHNDVSKVREDKAR